MEISVNFDFEAAIEGCNGHLTRNGHMLDFLEIQYMWSKIEAYKYFIHVCRVTSNVGRELFYD